MKARLRKTGEVVDIISYSGLSSASERGSFDYVYYIDSNGVEHREENNLNLYWDFETISDDALSSESKSDIDWKSVRKDIAMILVDKESLEDYLTSRHWADRIFNASDLLTKRLMSDIEEYKGDM